MHCVGRKHSAVLPDARLRRLPQRSVLCFFRRILQKNGFCPSAKEQYGVSGMKSVD